MKEQKFVGRHSLTRGNGVLGLDRRRPCNDLCADFLMLCLHHDGLRHGCNGRCNSPLGPVSGKKMPGMVKVSGINEIITIAG